MRGSLRRGGTGRPGRGAGTHARSHALARALVLALALGASLLLGACAALNDSTSATAPTPPPRLEETLSPAQRQEHERLVASYGGAYNNPKLQAQIEGVVNRLVAASERPNLHYRVTILNSPAVNAFALPNGSLYVTRGLLSLASDNSELASVLSHEMAHVIANHAATREDQMKQAVLVSRVISDVVNDSDLGALALARSRISLASFSRGQELEADAIGVGISARAGFDPYGAERFLTTMGRQASIRSSSMSQSASADTTDFLASHPATPERISIVMANAREYASPDKAGRARPQAVSRRHRRPRLWRRPEGRLRARPALLPSQARLHLHRAGRLHAGEHLAGGARRQHLRPRGAAARRGARRRRPVAGAVPLLRLDRGRRDLHRGEPGAERLPRRHRGGARRAMVVPHVRHPLRQRRLPADLRRAQLTPSSTSSSARRRRPSAASRSRRRRTSSRCASASSRRG